MIAFTKTMKKLADQSYKNSQVIEFSLKLPDNQYVNASQIHLCLPIKFAKPPDENTDLENTMIPVNSFFAHWNKETQIKR